VPELLCFYSGGDEENIIVLKNKLLDFSQIQMLFYSEK